MKKILFSILALTIGFMAYAQPVSDNAVIPVSVSLTGILRLNVTSGGNIEFQVSTLQQYKEGIKNSTQYDTRFTVASSTDFNVIMSVEDAELIGTDDSGNTMALNNIMYNIITDGTGAAGTNWDLPSGYVELVQTPAEPIVRGIGGSSAGDIAQNAFLIHWALNNPTGTAGTLLSQGLQSDRYSTNVFLTVKAQ